LWDARKSKKRKPVRILSHPRRKKKGLRKRDFGKQGGGAEIFGIARKTKTCQLELFTSPLQKKKEKGIGTKGRRRGICKLGSKLLDEPGTSGRRGGKTI